MEFEISKVLEDLIERRLTHEEIEKLEHLLGESNKYSIVPRPNGESLIESYNALIRMPYSNCLSAYYELGNKEPLESYFNHLATFIERLKQYE